MRALKMMALAGATALGLSFAGQASATDYTVPLQFGNGVYTGNFGADVSGAFSDSFTFSLPTISTGSTFTLSTGSVTSSSVITNLQAYLDVPANAFSIAQFGTSPFTYTFGGYSGGGLTSGTHTIFVSGNTGTASYSGTIAIAAAAVPEPASWAMMIGGVGFVGGMMRRRVKRTANGVAFA